ncbi:hypothetical protein BGZ76_010355 [Entomortierella beljakovae]|nr:hypothetical protein BGZ76_010355 [Entomortierella beljakovae]
MVSWSTEFQLKAMDQNTLIACMDSTHKTVKELKCDENLKVYKSSFLFTLLVKDRNFQKGIPISYMICNSESKIQTQKIAPNDHKEDPARWDGPGSIDLAVSDK